MPSTVLKLHGQNKITLPSSFRKRFPTMHFFAIDKGKELIITPILKGELDNDLVLFHQSLQDSLLGKVTKHASPKDFFKKMKNAA